MSVFQISHSCAKYKNSFYQRSLILDLAIEISAFNVNKSGALNWNLYEVDSNNDKSWKQAARASPIENVKDVVEVANVRACSLAVQRRALEFSSVRIELRSGTYSAATDQPRNEVRTTI